MPRKLVLYIATSLDGYIAQPNDDLSFLSIVQKEGEDYGYQAFISQVDTVILGRKTYDWVMGQVDVFPHADKETYVVTRSARPAEGNVHFYSGDVPELVQGLKAADGKVIFCDGGSELVQVLLKHKLIDELIISVIPVMVGEGTRLFHDGRPYQALQLTSVQSFETGLVQLHYKAL